MKTSEEWTRILHDVGVRPFTAAKWGDVFADEIDGEAFNLGEEELLDFLPNILHESAMLERLEENLNYSARRLTEVWPGRFPNEAVAAPYANNPRALANRAYGGRMGNTGPDDGWTYRGRGIIMITGRDNYERVGDLMQQDLIGIPDLLAQPRYSLEAAILWWEDKIPDSMLGETTAIRSRVNGGKIGLADVVALKAKLERLL